MKEQKLLLLFIFCILRLSLFAQVNFTGTWVLMDMQAVFGPSYKNALPKQVKIDHQKDSLFIEMINVGNDGKDLTSHSAMALDGKAFSSFVPSTKRHYVRNLEWSGDKKSLIITTAYYLPESDNEIDFTRIDTWSFLPDIKQLSIDRKSVETRGESWETNGTFSKIK